ncbi:MAG: PIN domain-containing protein [Leptospiraceae bacterium]|nr:PIN domain-containing protein [Leptospiraceae bacterium]
MLRVLIDTNIWIDYIKGKESSLVVQEIVSKNFAFRYSLIEGELRLGFIPNRNQFLERYRNLPSIQVISHEIVFQFIEKEKLFGISLNFVDISIYALARMNDCLIWTSDKNLRKLCESKKILFDWNKHV